MRTPLRAGIAVYNEGYYHAAHDAWEDHWLDLETGSADERLLHGLIQFTAAVYHARERNWTGAVGLAESGRGYLAALEPDERGCNVGDVRRFLAALERDPELIERRPALALSHDGVVLSFDELDPAETAAAATVLAEAWGYDEEPLERAGAYALADLEAGRDDSRFLSLLYDFVREDAARGVIYRRLESHVERRTSKEEDVEGLF